jgi:hypothetical protein
MKKNNLWMLAAILLCGLATVFISCSKDDDGDKPKTPEEEQPGGKEDPKAASADVTLTLIIQRSTLNAFEYDFKYVDTKGTTKTWDIDAETEGVALDDFEKAIYNTYVNLSLPMYGEELVKDMQNPLVLRFTLKDQPTGKQYSYETIMHVKKDFKFTDTFFFCRPSVIVTETPKGGQRTTKGGSFSIQVNKITADSWERYVTAIDGKASINGTFELTVNE